jgi:drug/metabolite transporter (DMT)-like permease
MTRRALALFALMSVVWGVPYLLIKVAVEHLTPAVVVEGRTLIGGLLLLPLAWREGRIRELAQVWRPLALYCICELAIPWFLLSDAEKRLPSSLSGLLVATVPLTSAVLAYASGHHNVLDRRALGGLALGLGGVAVLLGLDVRGAALGSVGMVLIVAVGYAIGPFLVSRSMTDQSSLALASVSLMIVAIAYLPVAVVQAPHRLPAGRVIASVIGLGVICTAVAFVAFFELIKETTPTQATIITYFNPVVAVALGVAVLGEPLKAATAVGFVLILVGSWFATGRSRRSETILPAVRSGGPETAE